MLNAVGLGLQLSQRLTQTLILSPQMQQSLALLQAPTLELKALVEQELQQNPMLEEMSGEETDLREKSERDSDEIAAPPDPAEPPEDVIVDPTVDKNADVPVDDFQAEFEKLIQMDQDWREHFSQTNIPVRQSPEDEERRQFMFDSLTAGTSLAQHLLDQVREADLSPERLALAELIIGNIDDYGYVKATLEELTTLAGVPAEQVLELLKLDRKSVV